MRIHVDVVFHYTETPEEVDEQKSLLRLQLQILIGEIPCLVITCRGDNEFIAQ